MPSYTITPLKVGTLKYRRSAFTSKPDHSDEPEIFPIISFLIQGNGHNILVDTGGGDPDSPSMKSAGHAESHRSAGEAPDQALIAVGLQPEQIDTVVITHLHWDHCYNNHLFPQAEFYVQKCELMEAVCPAAHAEGVYESFSKGVIPPWARQPTKWHIVDGACELCSGVTLLPMPGHTVGLQGVLIQTEKGPYLLPSDAVPLYECIEELTQGTYHISSLCADPDAFRKTFDFMRRLTLEDHAVILASHDFLTLEHPVYPV